MSDPRNTFVYRGLVWHNETMADTARLAERDWPRTYRLCCGRRFQLPNDRQPDYPHYTNAGFHDVTALVAAVGGVSDPMTFEDKDVTSASFVALNAWIAQGTTTLFVEREPAEALLRTDLPESFTPVDIHWRRNAFRLFPPKGPYFEPHDSGLALWYLVDPSEASKRFQNVAGLTKRSILTRSVSFCHGSRASLP